MAEANPGDPGACGDERVEFDSLDVANARVRELSETVSRMRLEHAEAYKANRNTIRGIKVKLARMGVDIDQVFGARSRGRPRKDGAPPAPPCCAEDDGGGPQAEPRQEAKKPRASSSIREEALRVERDEALRDALATRKRLDRSVGRLGELVNKNNRLRRKIRGLEEDLRNANDGRAHAAARCSAMEDGLRAGDRELARLKGVIGRLNEEIRRLNHYDLPPGCVPPQQRPSGLAKRARRGGGY